MASSTSMHYCPFFPRLYAHGNNTFNLLIHCYYLRLCMVIRVFCCTIFILILFAVEIAYQQLLLVALLIAGRYSSLNKIIKWFPTIRDFTNYLQGKMLVHLDGFVAVRGSMCSEKWPRPESGYGFSFCNWIIINMKWAGLVYHVDGRKPVR